MHPEQAFSWTQADQRSARDRIGGGLPLSSASSIRVNSGASPPDVLYDVDEVDGLAKMERLHTAVDFFGLELRRFMNCDVPRRSPRMATSIEIERSGHHPEHLGA